MSTIKLKSALIISARQGNNMNKQKNRGFTLLELMIAIAIVGIITSIAVPSFQNTLERNGLKEAAESLKSDLMFARTEAIKRSTDLNVSIDINGTSWCYGIDDDATSCDCTSSGSCAIKTVNGSQFQDTSLTAGTDIDVTFQFRRGTASANGATINSDNYSARVVVSNLGRIRICSPNSSRAIGGYDAC